jgi:digeranylgeranylglycerophospholipid reductase
VQTDAHIRAIMSLQTPTHDVLVVGAGPAGLYTALRAAEEGLAVLVLEEHSEIGVPTHCTGIVSGETNQLYKLPRELILNRPSSCLVVSPGGCIARLDDPGEDIAVLDRAAFDRSLAASVLEVGGMVRTNCRVDHVRRSDKLTEVETNHGERLRARALVLGCGVTFRFHSLMGTRLPSAILHTAQMELSATPTDALEVHVGRKVAPEGFAWVVPFRRADATYVKAGVVLRGDASAYLRTFLARPAIASRLRESPSEPIRRLLPLAPVARSYADRIVAVGDAAGLTKPVSGGGIFYSLLSAQFAAETLIDALADDDLSAARLSQYERRWRDRLVTEIRISRWFRDRLAGFTDREWDRLVVALASDDVQSVIKRDARFNWHSSLILSMIKQAGIRSILFRSLFR